MGGLDTLSDKGTRKVWTGIAVDGFEKLIVKWSESNLGKHGQGMGIIKQPSAKEQILPCTEPGDGGIMTREN